MASLITSPHPTIFKFPLVAVFQPGDSLLQITRDTQAIRFYAFCQTKMSHGSELEVSERISAQYHFLNGRKRAKKYPVLGNWGQHTQMRGRMTANPWHGSHLVSLCVLCMFSPMHCMKTSKNRMVFSVFLFFSSLF